MLEYFRTNLADDKDVKLVINAAFMDATGREANLVELVAYRKMIKEGRDTTAIYADAVAQMNKYPQERAAMINRAYQTAMGRDANPGDLQYWQPRKESYKELVAAARTYLYSPNGENDLKETVTRAYQARYPGRPASELMIRRLMADYVRKKAIYTEMLR